MSYVLDACSLIAFFNDEEGAHVVSGLFRKAVADEVNLLVHAINVYEVCYDCLRHSGDQKANEILEAIMSLPTVVVWEIDVELLKLAGKFKVEEDISVADSFALALAKKEAAPIVTADHREFDKVVVHYSEDGGCHSEP